LLSFDINLKDIPQLMVIAQLGWQMLCVMNLCYESPKTSDLPILIPYLSIFTIEM